MKLNKKDATNPFYTIFHPFDCSWDIRFKQKGSYAISGVILVVLFLATIFQRQNTSYIFNSNNLSELNIFIQLLGVALPYGLFVVANWIMSILMNGTGRFRDIAIYTAYCVVPYGIGIIVSTMMSNVLVKEEPFAEYVFVFGAAWSVVILFIGLMVMHQYGFVQSVFSIFCTVCVMFILLFLIMMVGSLATDLYSFVGTIIKEIGFRIS